MNGELKITVLSGPSSGDVFNLTAAGGSPITIGRSEKSLLVLCDPIVSREHAAIEVRDSGVFIVDLGSSHGTVHMGFKLSPGKEGGRELCDGDEFKIGQALFRINFAEEQPVEKAQDSSSVEQRTSPIKKAKSSIGALRGRTKVLIVVILVLAVLYLLVPEQKRSSLPKQHPKEVFNIPEFRLLGYWPGSSKMKDVAKDSHHLDKVQFYLPASDVLVEYDYLSETRVNVLIDKSTVSELGNRLADDGWEHRQLIIRDVLQGGKRRLIFDNLDYPRTQGKGGGIKRWAVRNVRTSPLSRELDSTFDVRLESALALLNSVQSSPSGLFEVIRALRLCILELMVEQNRDAVDFGARLETEEVISVDEGKIRETLEAIQNERKEAITAEASNRQLEALVRLTSELDGELWRRVNARFRQAMFSSKAKNYIVAHDNLIAIKRMFPDEADYRWIRAHRRLINKKIIPKRIREKPGRYRR